MSEMIERVARAMWRECEPSSFGWEESDRDNYRRLARAAIAAMREPTIALYEAGGAAVPQHR